MTLAAIALLLMLNVSPYAAPAMPLIALLIMSLALACAYDAAMERALRLRRRPAWRAAGLLLLCLPIALTTFSAIGLLLPLHRDLAWAELLLLLATPFTVIACAIVLLVVSRMIASALHVSPPAWPGSTAPE